MQLLMRSIVWSSGLAESDSLCVEKNALMSSRDLVSQNDANPFSTATSLPKTFSFGWSIGQCDVTNDQAKGRATGLSKNAARYSAASCVRTSDVSARCSALFSKVESRK